MKYQALADYILFLDDERNPEDFYNVRIARDFWEFKRIVSEFGIPKFVSFDIHLGDSSHNGYECAVFLSMCLYDLPLAELEKFTFTVHSADLEGAERLHKWMDAIIEEIKREYG